MKTIEYKGYEFSIPVWVEYIATDWDGSVHGYNDVPIWKEYGLWVPQNHDHSEYIRIGEIPMPGITPVEHILKRDV